MKRRALRLVVLAAIGCLLAGSVLFYRAYWMARPMGEGPAGPAVPREPFAKVWTERKVLLLGVGDSITAGFGVPQSHSLLGRIAQNPDDEWPDMQGISLAKVLPNLEVRNIAISGSTSLEHRERLEGFPVQGPDVLGVVVMTSGGNDLIHDYGRSPPREGAMYGATLDEAQPWIANFETRLAECLDLLDARFPGGCHVFLADIYDPTDGVGDAPAAGLPPWPGGLAIHAAYNEVIHRVAGARPNVHVVPLYETFLGHGVHCRQFWRRHYRAEDPCYWYGFNLEDPNIRGYDAARRVFLMEMGRVAERLSE